MGKVLDIRGGGVGGDLSASAPGVPYLTPGGTTISVPWASESQAAAGTNQQTLMNPLRVSQAISALGVSTSDSRLSDARTPTGSAGGDLAGAYPNPTLTALSPSPAGTFGSAAAIPVVTVDAKGRVVAMTTATPSLVDVQEFTADGTWTKPSGKSRYRLEMFGPGGSGGGGARSSTTAGGGSGGSPGARVIAEGPLSELGATETVTIGQPGAVGVGATSANTAGTAGSVGTATTFGPYTALPGNPGNGGTTSAGGAAPTGISSTATIMLLATGQSRDGGAGGYSAAGSNPASSVYYQPTGGGGGGGAAVSSQQNGGQGGMISAGAQISNAAGGLGGIKGTRSPSDGGSRQGCGLGGGGGCGSNTGSPGQAGAKGGNYGGGGGGGGGYGSQNGGNGGLGGDAYLVITCW